MQNEKKDGGARTVFYMRIHTLSECIVMVDDEKYILNNEQANECKKRNMASSRFCLYE